MELNCYLINQTVRGLSSSSSAPILPISTWHSSIRPAEKEIENKNLSLRWLDTSHVISKADECSAKNVLNLIAKMVSQDYYFKYSRAFFFFRFFPVVKHDKF